MLSDHEISLITLFRGVSFTVNVLKVPRNKVIQTTITSVDYELFRKIRKEVLKIGKKKGLNTVKNLFGIDQEIFLVLKQAQGKTTRRRKKKNTIPVKMRKVEVERIQGPEPVDLVTSDSLFKDLKKNKKVRFIEDKLSAVSKAFIVQEAEKSSSRFSICEKFDIDRTTISRWAKSYYESGVVKGSRSRYKMASELLQRSYNELVAEEKASKIKSLI